MSSGSVTDVDRTGRTVLGDQAMAGSRLLIPSARGCQDIVMKSRDFARLKETSNAAGMNGQARILV
jgi:hypothetical protein